MLHNSYFLRIRGEPAPEQTAGPHIRFSTLDNANYFIDYKSVSKKPLVKQRLIETDYMRDRLLCHKVVSKNEFILPVNCYMIPEKNYIIHVF